MMEFTNLTKRYGDMVAVNDVSFSVQPGRVTGFLGPNGAGKSTAMRILVGLATATSGRATVLGRPFPQIDNPGRRVGVLLDASAQHAGRSGRETLTLSAQMMGLDRRRVDEMLDVVGLTPSESRRLVRNYSLGMRQRLGIANALMGDPQVLILDEPVNGLDPAGIRWMRDLLRGFADEGGTVLLSSHLLHEIQVVADDLVMIGRGRIVAQGSLDELTAWKGTMVRSTDDAALAAALTKAGIGVTMSGRTMLAHAAAETIGRIALGERIVLVELTGASATALEDLFLQLTADDAREAVAA